MDLSRPFKTVGADRIIDEMIFKCTHTTVRTSKSGMYLKTKSAQRFNLRQEIDYFLPGIKPTGKPLELTVVGIVAFRGDKLTFE